MKSSPAEVPPRLTGLPPLIDDRSRVLVLGSFPSEESLRRQQYYAYSRNQFWPIMAALFHFDSRASYEDRVSALLDGRVAVWDVIHRCIRKGSADQAIQDDEPNALLALISTHPGISHIAFNGGRAVETARRQVPDLLHQAGVTWHQMPSTSPAHAGRSFQEKLQAWSRISAWLKSTLE
jgi:hypoxanthine-DNA glycosylase